MLIPARPATEQARQLAVADYVPDVDPEQGLDALTRLVALTLQVPTALISIVDAEHQWFKSAFGHCLTSAARDVSFCGHVVASGQQLIVQDAFQDERFRDNPSVVGELRVRFYAASPLTTPDGHVLGTICAIDSQPRELSAREREVLDLCAAQVMAQLELGRKERYLRQAANEARAKEAHFRTLFRSTADGVTMIDIHGNVVDCNPAAENILGRPREQLLGRSALAPSHVRLIHADGRPMTDEERPGHRALKSGQPTTNLIMGMQPDTGEAQWLSISGTPLRYGDTDSVNGVVLTFRDITASQRARVAQARSEARFRALVNLAPVGIFETDSAGHCVYVNDQWVAITGISAEQATGDGWARAIHPEDAKSVFDKWQSTACAGSPYEDTFRFLRPDGQAVFVIAQAVPLRDEDGNITSHLGTVIDITRLRQTEEALRRTEATFRSLIERAPIGVGVRVGPVVKFANGALLRAHGASSLEQAVGLDIFSSMLPKSKATFAARLARIQRGESPGPEVFHFSRIDGKEAVLEIDSIPVEFEGAPAVMSLVRDVSELELARGERDSAHAALVESLAQKETLLREIHHRVKNNLQVITSLLRLRRSSLSDNAALAAFDDSIARIHAIALLHERLYRSANLDRVDLRSYLRDILDEVARTYLDSSYPVKFELSCAQVGLNITQCVPLGLIVNELLTNALKHAFNTEQPAHPVVKLTFEQNAEQCQLLVSDNGVGMPQSANGSDSLGMILVESLAQQLLGTAEVQSAQGTTWRIRFPLRTQLGDSRLPQ